jgi:hypothetical protein
VSWLAGSDRHGLRKSSINRNLYFAELHREADEMSEFAQNLALRKSGCVHSARVPL